MNRLTREQIIEIAAKLKTGAYPTEKEADQAVAALKAGVTDPNITDYIFFHEMTPEEIADKALAYQPIML